MDKRAEESTCMCMKPPAVRDGTPGKRGERKAVGQEMGLLYVAMFQLRMPRGTRIVHSNPAFQIVTNVFLSG